jgi:hypothetical protein
VLVGERAGDLLGEAELSEFRQWNLSFTFDARVRAHEGAQRRGGLSTDPAMPGLSMFQGYDGR